MYLGHFGACCTLGKQVAVDEAMVKFYGRNSMKQYMQAKPIKHGIKMLCDSNTYYCLKFSVYLGRQNNSIKHELAYNVVRNMTSDINWAYVKHKLINLILLHHLSVINNLENV